ncbi:hypothetical protein CRG98_008781, partial [Punica granatum]
MLAKEVRALRRLLDATTKGSWAPRICVDPKWTQKPRGGRWARDCVRVSEGERSRVEKGGFRVSVPTEKIIERRRRKEKDRLQVSVGVA